MALEVENVTMTGADLAWKWPDDLRRAYFQVRTTHDAVTLKTTASGDGYLIKKNKILILQDRSLIGQTIYFNGTNTHILEILKVKGIG